MEMLHLYDAFLSIIQDINMNRDGVVVTLPVGNSWYVEMTKQNIFHICLECILIAQVYFLMTMVLQSTHWNVIIYTRNQWLLL